MVVGKGNHVGDWEGDPIIGKGWKSGLLTMVQRKTLYVVVANLLGKRADFVARTANRVFAPIKDRVKMIIFDNDLEFADHYSNTWRGMRIAREVLLALGRARAICNSF